MRRLAQIFNRITQVMGLKRASRPQDIPKKLDNEALQKALNEAEFLRRHQVDVKPVAPGEIPVPKRADH